MTLYPKEILEDIKARNWRHSATLVIEDIWSGLSLNNMKLIVTEDIAGKTYHYSIIQKMIRYKQKPSIDWWKDKGYLQKWEH